MRLELADQLFVPPVAFDVFVREDAPSKEAVSAARCAVAEYLRYLGVRDPDQLADLSRRIVRRARDAMALGQAGDAQTLAEAAVRMTVRQLDGWLRSLALAEGSADSADLLGSVVGARLPELLARYPDALKHEHLADELADSAQRVLTPVVPPVRPRRMRRQSLALLPAGLAWIFGYGARRGSNGDEPATADAPPPDYTLAVRMALAMLTAVSTGLATRFFWQVISAAGWGAIDLALAALFASLFVWVAFSFWMATFGFVSLFRKRSLGSTAKPARLDETRPTAIVMPVYNEAPAAVFAKLRAMVGSLAATGNAGAFHFFVLSDTTNPDIWLEEERAWARFVAEAPASLRVFYRHRAENRSRKAGNIADFCQRWGARYELMIVLDADSVMAGPTMVEMVRRMQHDPELGILQAPPRPVNRASFFARMQQFAAETYGPVFLEGYRLWSHCDGNYWGHNAIIRVQPFMEHCDLPVLPGDGPLGGEILSHDFVEAALMRRAGWKVCLAHDLGGSYEECPTTLLDFARRDQRWCQGNLQHVRLLLAEGLRPASRLHLGMGAMSYLASPLWLSFLTLTLLAALVGGDTFVTGRAGPSGAALFAVTMAMLLVPKLWGVIVNLRQARPSVERASGPQVLASAAVETLASMLLAPIMMLLHTQFVVATLLGAKVTWNAQSREDHAVPLGDAVRTHYGHTLIGLFVAAVVWQFAPEMLPWLAPVFVGLLLAVPVAMLLGNPAVGSWLARRGLLLISEEISPPALLAAAEDEPTDLARSGYTPFAELLHDPTFYALHVGILRATDGHRPASPVQLQEARQRVVAQNLDSAPADLRRAILGDLRALETLHVLSRCHRPPERTALSA
ncbi:MAG: glucans biosynthesis glucosyltransferase MdoH [Pirellulales bacterium]